MKIEKLQKKISDAMGALADEIKAQESKRDKSAELSALTEALRITSLILQEKMKNEKAAALYLEARAAAFQELERKNATAAGAQGEREKTEYRP